MGRNNAPPTLVANGIIVRNNKILEELRTNDHDLSESPQIHTCLQSFMDRPATGSDYVRVDVIFKDLDGDQTDPYNNLLGVRVYNSAGTTRNGNLYQDVAGATALTTSTTLTGGFRELVRLDTGHYVFYYRVAAHATIEPLQFLYTWIDEMYYDTISQEYFVEGSQIVNYNNRLNEASNNLNDLSESLQINVALQHFLDRPSTGSRYVRVDIAVNDLDGDPCDPTNQELGVRVYNNASTSRNTNLYKDVAGAASLDAPGMHSLAAFLLAERTGIGRYYYFYRVQYNHIPEELIHAFGWVDQVYYDDENVAYHYEPTQVLTDNLYATTEDLNQAAATYDLFTATGDVLIEDLVFRLPDVDVSDDTSITSISIQTDNTTPTTFISAVQGVKANLTAEAEMTWSGSCLLKNGNKIQLTIAGGAADDATVCDIVVKSKVVTDNAILTA